jgi:hypothetical protein
MEDKLAIRELLENWFLWRDTGDRLLTRVEEEASRHGVGLVTAGDPADYETWEERVEAVYTEPSPHALNDFISLQFSTRSLSSRMRRSSVIISELPPLPLAG